MVNVNYKLESSPLFIQTKEWIIKELENRKLKVGDKIPSENEFCRKSSVSIRTIRRALAELEKDGIIIRRQGRGSFLCKLQNTKQKKEVGTIGIIFSDMIFVTRPKFAKILQAIEARVHELGYTFHLYSSGDRTNMSCEMSSLGKIIPKSNVTGLIATSALNSKDITWIRQNKIPLVTFNDYRKVQTCVVRCDYYLAARQGVRHLIEQGYGNIAFLCGHLSDGSLSVVFNNDYFLQGIKDELKASGIKFDRDMVFQTNLSKAEGTFVAQRLLEKQNCPDAFFTFDDMLAAGVLDAFVRNGKETGLLTCGGAADLRNVSNLHLPMTEMGQAAVDLLVRVIEGDSSIKKSRIFKPELKVYSSTRTCCLTL